MLRTARTLAGVGVPLVFGAVFYVLLRPTEAWLVEPLTRWSPIASVRPVTVAFGASLPSIVLDVAPDLAWAGALGALRIERQMTEAMTRDRADQIGPDLWPERQLPDPMLGRDLEY